MSEESLEMKIESGIPIPESKSERWPFAEMAVGDSFFCGNNYKVYSAASVWGKRHGVKFRVQAVPYGLRCWRIK